MTVFVVTWAAFNKCSTVPGLRQGFPLGTLLMPLTTKLPVSSRMSTVLWSDCTSSTVPCIQTTDTVKQRWSPEPRRLITYSALPLAVWHSRPSRSWLDKTFTGGLRALSALRELLPIIFSAATAAAASQRAAFLSDSIALKKIKGTDVTTLFQNKGRRYIIYFFTV